MKILMTGFPTMGGSGLIATRLGLELANLGHEIHFAFYKRPFFLHDFDEYENITFHQIGDLDYALFRDIGSPYTLQSASIMAKIVAKHKIDIIHSHYAIPHAVSAYLASQINPVHTVTTLHGSDVHTLGNQESYNPIMALALKNHTRITAVSNFLANEARKIFNLDFMPIDTIYDFIDTQEFHPKGYIRDKTIILASNFRPIKQIPKLIEIFSMVSNEFPEWKLQLVGNGPDWPIAVREVRKHRLGDRVEFLGVRTDIPDLFARSSILASTSKLESFGLTLAEAMACETPVWAPRTGGIPELDIDGNAGYIFDPESDDNAVHTLTRLMSDEELRIKFGKNGRSIIKNRFDTGIIVKKYENLYEELCQEIPMNDPKEITNFHELFQ